MCPECRTLGRRRVVAGSAGARTLDGETGIPIAGGNFLDGARVSLGTAEALHLYRYSEGSGTYGALVTVER